MHTHTPGKRLSELSLRTLATVNLGTHLSGFRLRVLAAMTSAAVAVSVVIITLQLACCVRKNDIKIHLKLHVTHTTF